MRISVEEAKILLPVLEAFVEGKEIEKRNINDFWIGYNEKELEFNSKTSFDDYRVKED